MIISALKIPDGTYEAYEKFNPSDPKQAMAQQLIRFHGADPTKRILVIPAAQRAELEALCGSSLESAEELLSFVRRLLTMKIEGVELTLPRDVVQRLAEQAVFNGRDLPVYLKEQGEWTMRHLAGEA